MKLNSLLMRCWVPGCQLAIGVEGGVEAAEAEAAVLLGDDGAEEPPLGPKDPEAFGGWGADGVAEGAAEGELVAQPPSSLEAVAPVTTTRLRI